MNSKIFVTIVAAFVMVGALLIGMNTAPAIQAAPAAAPTPVASGFSGKAPSEQTWLSGVATTADGGSAAVNVAGWQVVDIQYVIDQGVVNTVTLKLQFSNDGVNWTDGATLVTDNAADASVLSQAAVFGKYARVHANVTNTEPVTITAIGILK